MTCGERLIDPTTGKALRDPATGKVLRSPCAPSCPPTWALMEFSGITLSASACNIEGGGAYSFQLGSGFNANIPYYQPIQSHLLPIYAYSGTTCSGACDFGHGIAEIGSTAIEMYCGVSATSGVVFYASGLPTGSGGYVAAGTYPADSALPTGWTGIASGGQVVVSYPTTSVSLSSLPSSVTLSTSTVSIFGGYSDSCGWTSLSWSVTLSNLSGDCDSSTGLTQIVQYSNTGGSVGIIGSPVTGQYYLTFSSQGPTSGKFSGAVYVCSTLLGTYTALDPSSAPQTITVTA